MAVEEPWHLDKRVPVALILTLLAQFGFGVWWVSQADSRMAAAEASNNRQDVQIASIESLTSSQAVSAATLAAQMDGLRQSVGELKQAQRETNDLLRQIMQGGVP